MVARLAFPIKEHHSLQEEVEELQKNNKVSDYQQVEVETHTELSSKRCV